MVRIFLLVAFLASGSLAQKQPLNYGMDMGTKSYDAICWYEYLKNYPDTYTSQYFQCADAAQNVQRQIEQPSAGNAAYMSDPKNQESAYGSWMTSMAMNKLPSDYQTACNQYLSASRAVPTANEADALGDTRSTEAYPFRAFAYCLISKLRSRKGANAVQAVKNERTNQKAFLQTMLDRENEFRARHGSAALKIDAQLNSAAQKWAEVNARDCKMYHSANSDAGRQYQGQGTGESLSCSGGAKNQSQIAGYLATDGWYEEIKDYPFPESYQGNGQDPLFSKIGHFTQSVWKGSQYVGYGYAFNPNCSPYTGFVAARYFPAGNWIGKFADNVAPPK